MKNIFLKLSTVILLSVNITACEFQNFISLAPDITGKWENVLKNSDGATIITSLNVKDLKKKVSQQKYESFTYSASLNSEISGQESDNVKITTKNINISGKFNNGSLSIDDVESENESITTQSRFLLSEDNKYLTLLPGDVKFKRK